MSHVPFLLRCREDIEPKAPLASRRRKGDFPLQPHRFCTLLAIETSKITVPLVLFETTPAAQRRLLPWSCLLFLIHHVVAQRKTDDFCCIHRLYKGVSCSEAHEVLLRLHAFVPSFSPAMEGATWVSIAALQDHKSTNSHPA